MRMIATALLAATACTPQSAPANADGMAVLDNAADAMPGDPFSACDGTKANALIGRLADAALQAEALRLVGARTTRVIAPGMAVTMDYRGDRLNIETDERNRALRFRCG